jgi:hypothetical protein
MASSRYIPSPIKRVVVSRDDEQRTSVDVSGRRCSQRRWLEFHHDDPYGRGGDREPAKVRLLCRSHNLLRAEKDYGRKVIDSYRRQANPPGAS